MKSCQVVSDFRRSSVVSSFNQANEMIISSVLRKVEIEYSLNNIIIIIISVSALIYTDRFFGANRCDL